MRSLATIAVAAVVVFGGTPGRARAQAPLTGFAAEASARETAFETSLASAVDTARLRRHLQSLATDVRVAGTPALAASAQYVLDALAGYGLDTTRAAYRVYLPYPDSLDVYRLRPRFVSNLPLRLLLNEIPVKGDSFPDTKVWRAMAAYSGGGDVSGPLVFANFGRAEDYRTLDSLGVDVRGKVVLVRDEARAGAAVDRVRAAEARGAIALVSYSDPMEDGYFRGDPFPIGRMRPPDGVERASLQFAAGDPSTPGWASTAEARRLPPDSMAVPRIPVVPISYRNVMYLLPVLGGASVPQAWQGGLPLRYHIGGDTNAIVRVAVWPETGDRAYKTITNTVATLRGAELPDEIVLVGAQRDAWGRGAADNASGVAALLEIARAMANAAREGHRPRRTIVFATWDASEWGRIGATEYAEQFGERLRGKVVAYLNAEVVVDGRNFSAAADPVLDALLREAGGVGSLLGSRPAGWGDGPVPAVRTSHYCGDCEPIRRLFGAPALEFGFRDPDGLLNSAYDGLPFLMQVDPDLRLHAAAVRFGAALVSRLANAALAADDYSALARSWADAVRRANRAGTTGAGSMAPVTNAVDAFEHEAQRWNDARTAAVARGRAVPGAADLRLAIAAATTAIERLEPATPAAEAAMVTEAARRVQAATDELARIRKALQ